VFPGVRQLVPSISRNNGVAFARLIHSKNLIPLCLRPLRLVLPSERMRSARIVLLKATHLPFIAAIFAYEHIADARKRDSSVTSLNGGPQTPLSSRKAPRLPVNTPRLLLADLQMTPSSQGKMERSSRPGTKVGQLNDPETEFRALVLKLSSQVDQLTEVVSRLQGQEREATVAS